MINNSFALRLERFLNIAQLLGVMIVLLATFEIQYLWHELPCPLCLLQRYGFMAMAFGFLLNMRFGFRPNYYAVVFLSALFTGIVSLRQIALHVLPNTGAYGSPVLGFHLYTWAFILSVLVLITTSIMLCLDRPWILSQTFDRGWRRLTHVLFFIVSMIVAANIVSVVAQCGIKQCADDPVKYELLG